MPQPNTLIIKLDFTTAGVLADTPADTAVDALADSTADVTADAPADTAVGAFVAHQPRYLY